MRATPALRVDGCTARLNGSDIYRFKNGDSHGTNCDEFSRRAGGAAGLVRKPKTDVLELTTPLPPEDLIFLVNGHRDRHQFALSRRASMDNIVSLLLEAGIDVEIFTSILDFGCGCGRILAGWEGVLSSSTYLAGVDINETLVAFCKSNIPFADVYLSNAYPRFDFPTKPSTSFTQLQFLLTLRCPRPCAGPANLPV
jgi:SAM-dependent methyltransferase